MELKQLGCFVPLMGTVGIDRSVELLMAQPSKKRAGISRIDN